MPPDFQTTVHICEDGGHYGPRSRYGYWSAWCRGRGIDFGGDANQSEKAMRAAVRKWFPLFTIVVEPSKIKGVQA